MQCVPETGQVEDERNSSRPIKTIYNLEKSSKGLMQDLRDASGPSVDPFTVGPSLIRNGLHGRVAVKKPFLRKGNREKRLSYAKLNKKWTENQWQQV